MYVCKEGQRRRRGGEKSNMTSQKDKQIYIQAHKYIIINLFLAQAPKLFTRDYQFEVTTLVTLILCRCPIACREWSQILLSFGNFVIERQPEMLSKYCFKALIPFLNRLDQRRLKVQLVCGWSRVQDKPDLLSGRSQAFGWPLHGSPFSYADKPSVC